MSKHYADIRIKHDHVLSPETVLEKEEFKPIQENKFPGKTLQTTIDSIYSKDVIVLPSKAVVDPVISSLLYNPQVQKSNHPTKIIKTFQKISFRTSKLKPSKKADHNTGYYILMGLCILSVVLFVVLLIVFASNLSAGAVVGVGPLLVSMLAAIIFSLLFFTVKT